MGKKFIQFFVVSILFISGFYLNADSQKPDQNVFAGRRTGLMAKMDEGIALFKSPKRVRNTSFGASFRQNSNCYYLTGLEEPDSVFLLIPGSKEKFILFIKEKNVMAEIWSGKMLGTAEAKEEYGVDQVFPLKELDKYLRRYLRSKNPVYCDFNDKEFMKKIFTLMPKLYGSDKRKLIDISPLIHEMRIIKSREEIQLMDGVARITAEAVNEAMKAARPGMFEYEIEAIINYVYQKHGCRRPGFKSIVASGANAAIMHYQSNNRKMLPGDLLLMDIGAEYGYYSGDITRTIPVSGKFTKQQREIYQIVLNAQKKGIQSVSPGKGLKEVMKVSTDTLVEGLYRLGLITNKKSRWQAMAWIKYFQTSHWLGLDTHDVGNYQWREKKGRILKPGMVFTIEPGIYIGENDLKNLPVLFKGRVKAEELQKFIETVKPAFEKYKNVSVRIEDDILVTENGCRVLSKDTPKEIRAVEKLMRKKSAFK